MENKSISMNKIYKIIITILISFSALGQQKPKHSIFLIGDAGEPNLKNTDLVLTSLQNQLSTSGKNGTLIFLGDNIYPKGLVSVGNPLRKQSEERFIAQLNVIQNFEGHSYIIPGNHDWEQGGKHGWENIKNQENFVADYLKNDSVFFPKGGCPTPQEIQVENDVVVVLLDTQWYLHPWNKPAENSDCEVKSLEAMLIAVDDILDRNKDKKVLVVGHHPMYSNGIHGGHFTFQYHLFPFHEENVYIPLPVIGSIYPLYRSLVGNIQDIAHPQYQEMRDGLVNIFKQYKNVMYANGHEHNLQLIVKDSINYITSGAGSKATPIKSGLKDSPFASTSKGFARIDFFDDQQVKLSFVAGDGGQGKELYTTNLNLHVSKATLKDVSDLTDTLQRTVIPNKRLYASSFKKWLLGDLYRDVWTKPIKVPYLDFQKEKGGLTVIQKGGGFQTLSLRYRAKEGGQYVTRSIEKYPEMAVPEAIRSEFTVDIVGDQIAACHPFSALVVPTLAKAVGVLHTNPKLVVIPTDTVLHQYKKKFSNQLALFEERPEEGFAGAKKTYSTLKVVEKLANDNHNLVDQKEVLRARLLDILIGDWDRHDDQWRWAGYDNGKGLTFKPIPRDRDQAFFLNQGFLPTIISRKWILPKFQGFSKTIRDVPGLNFNARYFDRSFLTNLELTDWQTMAKEFQNRITDAVIDSAITYLPQPDVHAKDIAEKLKQRRNDLVKYAELQYQFLAKGVDVVASDKDETIEVLRNTDGGTSVTVFDQNKKGEKSRILYNRTFNPDVTKEIRVWGFGGDDKFKVSGTSQKAIKLRLIGGKGDDTFADSSEVKSLFKKTLIYDETKFTNLYLGTEAKDLTSDKNAEINAYNREAFKYDKLAPVLSFAYNPDDGVFLGGGFEWTKQGFRKDPFASQHTVSGSYAFATNAFNLFYQGDFTDVIGKTDLLLKATLQQSSMTDNFFGLSNESVFYKDKTIDFYRVKLSNVETSAMLKSNFGQLSSYYGVLMNGYEVKENDKRFIGEFAGSGAEVYNEKDYLGVKAGLTFDNRNSKTLTTRGIYWDFNTTYQRGINSSIKDNYLNLKSELAMYLTVKLPALMTIATRFGGAVNLGDFEFYQANALGGLSNLRGYRRTRFSGKDSFYNNTEIRLKLFNFKSYLFPAYMGILAHNDVGRVWNVDESSQKWHHGYGGGVWFAPFNIAVISAVYSVSEEDNIFSIRSGFFF